MQNSIRQLADKIKNCHCEKTALARRRSNLIKRDCFTSFAMTQRGFTLIEIVVVLSFISILSTVGIAGFVNYSRTQKLNAAVLDVATMLQTAKSRALSQVKIEQGGCLAGTYSLTGYQVAISTDTYSLQEVCSNGTTMGTYELSVKTLPAHITFGSSQTFLFNVLTGSVAGATDAGVNITLTSTESNPYATKTIKVDTRGKIDIQ